MKKHHHHQHFDPVTNCSSSPPAVVDSKPKDLTSIPNSRTVLDVPALVGDVKGDVKIERESSKEAGGVDEGGRREEERKDKKLKPFKCLDCGKVFSQLRNYKYHR